jgi:RNA polymerase sigma-70 factor (ECF subfamily)
MRADSIRKEEVSAAELESLMIRYQQSDSSAAFDLVNQLSRSLLRFFAAQSISRRYADDLLQETWIRIHEARHTYRPGSPVLPWVYAIARHVRIDHYRRLSRLERRELQFDVMPESAPAGQEPASTTIDLPALLNHLPESQREVIAMLKVSGMSLEEVARATASTIGSVKQKAHRAYTKLNKILSGKNISSKESPHGTR